MTFKDRIVVITGGAHGIGKATKEAFALMNLDKGKWK